MLCRTWENHLSSEPSRHFYEARIRFRRQIAVTKEEIDEDLLDGIEMGSERERQG